MQPHEQYYPSHVPADFVEPKRSFGSRLAWLAAVVMLAVVVVGVLLFVLFSNDNAKDDKAQAFASALIDSRYEDALELTASPIQGDSTQECSARRDVVELRDANESLGSFRRWSVTRTQGANRGGLRGQSLSGELLGELPADNIGFDIFTVEDDGNAVCDFRLEGFAS